jgi:hypothetical protein
MAQVVADATRALIPAWFTPAAVAETPSISHVVLVTAPRSGHSREVFWLLLPLIVVMSTFVFLTFTFLICVIVVRRRRGIRLGDMDGPIDLSHEDLIEGEGGFEGVETRWLETIPESEQREYNRAKGNADTISILDFYVSLITILLVRLSNLEPAQLPANGYHTLAVLVYPRERRVRLGL